MVGYKRAEHRLLKWYFVVPRAVCSQSNSFAFVEALVENQYRSNNVEQPSGKLDSALWMPPANFPEGEDGPI